MTNRERLQRIFRGDLPDRPAVKLWGATPDQKLLHPAYAPVYRLAMESTDLVVTAGSQFDLHYGSSRQLVTRSWESPTDSPEWVDVITEVHAPQGELRSVSTRSTIGHPGRQKEYLLKQPEDIDKLLCIDYRPYPFCVDAFHAMQHAVGNRGLAMFRLDHAMYGLQRLIGSENFAIWSTECRDLLLRAMQVYSDRIRAHAVAALDAGLKPVFAWVGPELCIPPLMSPKDFDEFVVPFDKALIHLIHDRGGYVWVHCHGKMGPILDRFVDMGVDVLNPVEPPPMGDLSLPEAFGMVGHRVGLEGNIETHELMTATRDRIRHLTHEAIDAGRGKRFILCPTSGYMELPNPDRRLIQNLLTYVEEGVRYAAR